MNRYSRTDDSAQRPDGERPASDEIRRALNRILKSDAFRDSYRLKSFLSFIVEATLAGHGERLKAYTIAVEALGRDVNFDPQADPIIRVEAVRMRHALARYYSGSGSDDPLVIDVPRGRYIPTFRRREAYDAPPAVVDEAIAARRQCDRGQQAEIIRRCRELFEAIRRFRELARVHPSEVRVMTSAIVQAQHMLIESLTLLQICYRDDISIDPTTASAERIGLLEFSRAAPERVMGVSQKPASNGAGHRAGQGVS